MQCSGWRVEYMVWSMSTSDQPWVLYDMANLELMSKPFDVHQLVLRPQVARAVLLLAPSPWGVPGPGVSVAPGGVCRIAAVCAASEEA
jgi:hypothetical protein